MCSFIPEPNALPGTYRICLCCQTHHDGHQGKMPVMQRMRSSNCDHLEQMLRGKEKLGMEGVGRVGGVWGGVGSLSPGQGHILNQTQSVVLAGFLSDAGGVGVGFQASPELPRSPAHLCPLPGATCSPAANRPPHPRHRPPPLQPGPGAQAELTQAGLQPLGVPERGHTSRAPQGLRQLSSERRGLG